MATTEQNFVALTAAQLVGSTVRAAGQVVALNPSNATAIVAGGAASALDKVTADLATAALAKNGAATVALAGTTPKTIDLTDLTSITASYAGDTTFASFSRLTFKNLGAGSLTVAPGASNPASLGINGTTPSVTVQPGASVTISYPTPVTVDATHKTILLTPAADTTFSIAVGGA